ncbi:MAG: hypothetical protein CMJ48_09220 [Planctomycetaceae bacterium]|nr:hypothetical protein [Planctomycetaceae bacterium]
MSSSGHGQGAEVPAQGSDISAWPEELPRTVHLPRSQQIATDDSDDATLRISLEELEHIGTSADETPVDVGPDFAALARVDNGDPDFSDFGNESTQSPEAEGPQHAANETGAPPFSGVGEADGGPTAFPSRATESLPASEMSDSSSASGTSSNKGVRLLNRLVAYLAVVMTLVLLGVSYLVLRGPDPHQLESLPDLMVPPNVPQDKIIKWLEEGEFPPVNVPVDAKMPKGHTLELGERRRFGDIVVTPRRVTREPIRFVHFTGDPQQTRPPTKPVLKLWLDFENVSSNQPIAPLDKKLILTQVYQKQFGNLVANNFVRRRDATTDSVLLYSMSEDSEWDVKDQNPETTLKPNGGTFETFLATDEDRIKTLTGPLVWRVHFRKGYGPRTGLGVTTLVEVVFDSSQIVDRT